MKKFIADNKISMTCGWTDSNPNMDESSNMDNWKCIIKSARKQFTVYFSMGYGHYGKQPKIEDVLDCLASDASGFENEDGFESWASGYGYSTDSRKAERIYKTIESQAKRLKKFLGETQYNRLLWETERL